MWQEGIAPALAGVSRAPQSVLLRAAAREVERAAYGLAGLASSSPRATAKPATSPQPKPLQRQEQHPAAPSRAPRVSGPAQGAGSLQPSTPGGACAVPRLIGGRSCATALAPPPARGLAPGLERARAQAAAPPRALLSAEEVGHAVSAAARLVAVAGGEAAVPGSAQRRLAAGVAVAAQGMRPAVLGQALWGLAALEVGEGGATCNAAEGLGEGQGINGGGVAAARVRVLTALASVCHGPLRARPASARGSDLVGGHAVTRSP